MPVGEFKNTAAVSEKLKQLTDKIYEEGVHKAREDSAAILQRANEEAARIREDAQREREQLLQAAKETAAAERRKTATELRLATRKAISQLKESIHQLLTEKVIRDPVRKGLTDPETLAGVLVACAESLQRNKAGNFEIALAPDQALRIRQALEAGKQDLLSSGLVIREQQHKGPGFAIVPEGEGYHIRMDEPFFVELLSDYLSVQTRDWLNEENGSIASEQTA